MILIVGTKVSCWADNTSLDLVQTAINNNSNIVSAINAFNPRTHTVKECVEFYEFVLINAPRNQETIPVLKRIKGEWKKLEDIK